MIYSARDIAKQLADRAESFCHYLLPNGVKSAGNWEVGSTAGEAGHSMRIQLSGGNAGAWADFAGDARGDMLTLIKEVRQVDIRGAIKVAKEWLGLKEPENFVPTKTYTKPKPKDCFGFTTGSKVEKYLVSERKIDPLLTCEYQVEESPGKDGNAEIVFKSFSPDGELENVKYLAVKRDDKGKKLIRQYGGCAPCLFGWQAIDKEARELLITEGEIDALSWASMGFPAVSIPMGAGNNDQWIDYEWERLTQFDTIYLCYDNDAEGKKGAQQAAKRLGLHRCLIVKLEDHKDANEALQQNESPEFFQHAIASAKPLEPNQIKRPVDFRDKVVEKFYPPNDQPPGFSSHLFGGKYRARPGETTLWTGISSHGKSILLLQLVLEAIVQGFRAAVASMEMKGEQTLHRVICQSECCDRPPLEHVDGILNWMSGKLWLYDVYGNIPRVTLLSLMEYSFSRHGVDMFVIDSLMKTDIASDDYDGQRQFLNAICAFAAETGVHVHIVAHARKGKDESQAPGKLDVKGSVDIINQPDNVMSVWRNRDKEEKRQAHQLNDKAALDVPDTIVYCDKQRETGEEFRRELMFFRQIYRYRMMHMETFPNLSISQLVFGPTLDLSIQPGSNGEAEPEMFYDPPPEESYPQEIHETD